MTSSLKKALVVSAAALGALALGAGSASAATTFKVTAGSAPAGTAVAILGKTTGTSPQIAFTDVTSGTKLTCASGTAPGSITTGAARAGAGIARINGGTAKFNGCTGPLGVPLTVKGSGTWLLNATSGTATAVNGSISKISATVSGDGCSFTATGNVGGRYVNSNQTLVLTGAAAGLTLSNVQGCFGLLNEGDKASFKATYKINATNTAYNPIKVVPNAA